MKLKKIISVILAVFILSIVPLTAFATGDSYEDNDVMTDSKTIYPFYFSAYATIDVSNDVDWYDFRAIDNGYLTLKLVCPTGQNYDFYVWSDYQTVIGYGNNAGAGQTETITIPVTKDKYYFVMVGSPDSSCSDTQQYQLGKQSFTVTLNAAYEDNNTPYDAAGINIYSGTPIVAAIDSNNDVDYYEFTANSTGTLNLGLISPSGKNYDIYVLQKSNGAVVGQSNLPAGQTDIASCSVQNGIEYYVIIYGATSSDYYSNMPYQLYKTN